MQANTPSGVGPAVTRTLSVSNTFVVVALVDGREQARLAVALALAPVDDRALPAQPLAARREPRLDGVILPLLALAPVADRAELQVDPAVPAQLVPVRLRLARLVPGDPFGHGPPPFIW